MNHGRNTDDSGDCRTDLCLIRVPSVARGFESLARFKARSTRAVGFRDRVLHETRAVSEMAEGRGAFRVICSSDKRMMMSRSTSIGDWPASTLKTSSVG